MYTYNMCKYLMFYNMATVTICNFDQFIMLTAYFNGTRKYNIY